MRIFRRLAVSTRNGIVVNAPFPAIECGALLCSAEETPGPGPEPRADCLLVSFTTDADGAWSSGSGTGSVQPPELAALSNIQVSSSTFSRIVINATQPLHADGTPFLELYSEDGELVASGDLNISGDMYQIPFAPGTIVPNTAYYFYACEFNTDPIPEPVPEGCFEVRFITDATGAYSATAGTTLSELPAEFAGLTDLSVYSGSAVTLSLTSPLAADGTVIAELFSAAGTSLGEEAMNASGSSLDAFFAADTFQPETEYRLLMCSFVEDQPVPEPLCFEITFVTDETGVYSLGLGFNERGDTMDVTGFDPRPDFVGEDGWSVSADDMTSILLRMPASYTQVEPMTFQLYDGERALIGEGPLTQELDGSLTAMVEFQISANAQHYINFCSFAVEPGQ